MRKPCVCGAFFIACNFFTEKVLQIKTKLYLWRIKQTNNRVMARKETHRTAPNGRVYSAIYTEWGWFVRGTDGYNSSDCGEYFATKAQAMNCITKAFAMIRLEMKLEA